MSLENGLQYVMDSERFFVRYLAPSRDYGNIKTEFYNDARRIYDVYGKVYIGFSSGIDSQIIASCFSKQGIPAEYIFLHLPGYNDLELSRVKSDSIYLNIDVNVIELDIDLYKNEWIERSKVDNILQMHQYVFEWLSKNLSEDYPFITQGIVEPCIVGTKSSNSSIYVNGYENMNCRVMLMEKFRKIIDFPYSAESIASYYTDNAVKGFCSTIQSYYESRLFKDNAEVPQSDYWNYYAKSIVKGQYFLNDIVWHGKLSGFETFPEWIKSDHRITDTRVSVPYWDLVNFLEGSREGYKDYSDWYLGVDDRKWRSL